MSSIRAAIAVLVIATVASTASLAGDLTRLPAEKREVGLFTVVNATFDSVTGLATAPANSQAFEDAKLGAALPGGLTSATVRLPPGDCVRDVRVTFRDGRSQVFPGVDVCRSHGLRLGTQPS
jgi:hypothetical protein